MQPTGCDVVKTLIISLRFVFTTLHLRYSSTGTVASQLHYTTLHYTTLHTKGNSDAPERRRRLDCEKKRRARQCNPSSERSCRFNVERRLQPVVVKPEKLCKFCNKFLLYKHESNGFCCGSGKLTSLESQCFDIPEELLPVYENKYFGAWYRVVNNALRFSSPGNDVPGGMFFPGHPGHLRCCGHTYSRVLNGAVSQQCISQYLFKLLMIRNGLLSAIV